MKPQYGIPGLDGNRLRELYVAMLEVTGDTKARGDIVFSAKGDITIHVQWEGLGHVPHHFAKTLSGAAIARAGGHEDDKVFTDWAEGVIADLRVRCQQIAQDAAPAPELRFGDRVREAAGAFFTYLHHRRMNRKLDEAETTRDKGG